MRMSAWTPEIIHFMSDAAAYTPYFRIIADIVRDHTPSQGYICDAGCGMGQLSLELSRFAGRVDAIDKAPNAIAYLRDELERREIRNVATNLEDMHRIRRQEPYDVMAFCLSASLADAIRIGSMHCQSKVVVINKIQAKMDADRDRMATTSAHRNQVFTTGIDHVPGIMESSGYDERTLRPLVYNFEETLVDLAQQGICTEGRELSIDYGQPFRSLEDARLYFSLFRTRSYPAGITLNELEALLDHTDDEVFPYYLPVRRHLAAYVIDMTRVRDRFPASSLAYA